MFTVILPAYNEAKTLEKTVESLTKFLKKEVREKFALIIAEDGSTDGTDKIAYALAKKNKNIIVLHTKRRLGKGLALKRCSNYIQGDVVLFMDCGVNIDKGAFVSALEELRKGVEGPDVVIGSRYTNGSKSKRRLIRKITSIGYASLVKLLFFSKIKDFHCGFKAFKTPVFRQVNQFVKSNGWFWDTEFLLRAAEEDYAIKEIPIVWEEPYGSKISVSKDGWKLFFELIQLRLETFKR